MMRSFTEFKQDFYSQINDFALFDCGEVNLIKVVLDGLRVNYKTQYKVGSDFLLNPTLFNLKNKLRRIKSGNPFRHKKFSRQLSARKQNFIVGFSERVQPDSNGGKKSVYFENILNELKRDNCVFIGEDPRDLLDVDFKLSDLINTYSVLSTTRTERKFQKNLQLTFEKIKQAQIFDEDEMHGVRSAFEIFFKHHIAWNKILMQLKPRAAIFDQHYHREGFIFACRENKVKTIELQHGLIVEQDVFYIFPEKVKSIISKGLFADEILVYGNYWKNKLLKGCEYPAEKIKTIGFYHFEPTVDKQVIELQEFVGNSSVILVATQTNMHKDYIGYVSYLSGLIKDKNYNWKIIVKTHPAESPEIYESLNCFNCKVVSYPINYLFSISTIHLSVYSTTLYDAHRFNVKSYTVPIGPYSDYSKQISADGIAFEVLETEDPIAVYLNSQNTRSTETTMFKELYSPLDLNVLRKSINTN